MKPADENVRWLYVQHPISPLEAQQIRNEEIEHVLLKIKELTEEYRELLIAPLLESVYDYVPVKPGDKDYAKANYLFEPGRYHGTWKWKLEKK